MSTIKVTGDVGRKVGDKFKTISRAVVNGIVLGVDRESKDLHRFIVKEHLSGAGTDAASNRRKGKLRRRTGDMARKTKRVRTTKNGDKVFGGVDFQSKYAGVHVGEKGKVTTITPRNKQWLTIPLTPAMTRAGVARGGARDFPGLFFLDRGPGKNPLLVRREGGSIRPYFVLVKMVKIRTRIHPKQILKDRRQKILAGIRESIIEKLRGVLTN